MPKVVLTLCNLCWGVFSVINSIALIVQLYSWLCTLPWSLFHKYANTPASSCTQTYTDMGKHCNLLVVVYTYIYTCVCACVCPWCNETTANRCVTELNKGFTSSQIVFRGSYIFSHVMSDTPCSRSRSHRQ